MPFYEIESLPIWNINEICTKRYLILFYSYKLFLETNESYKIKTSLIELGWDNCTIVQLNENVIVLIDQSIKVINNKPTLNLNDSVFKRRDKSKC